MARHGYLGEWDLVIRVVEACSVWFSSSKKIVMKLIDVSEFYCSKLKNHSGN